MGGVIHSQSQLQEHAILQAKTNTCAGSLLVSSHHWGNRNKNALTSTKKKKKNRNKIFFITLGRGVCIFRPVRQPRVEVKGFGSDFLVPLFCIFTKPFSLLFHIVDWGPRWFYTSLLKTSNHNRILCRVLMLVLIQIRTYCIHMCKHFNQEGFNRR